MTGESNLKGCLLADLRTGGFELPGQSGTQCGWDSLPPSMPEEWKKQPVGVALDFCLAPRTEALQFGRHKLSSPSEENAFTATPAFY